MDMRKHLAALAVWTLALYAVLLTWGMCWVSRRMAKDSGWSDPDSLTTYRDHAAVFLTDLYFILYDYCFPQILTGLAIAVGGLGAWRWLQQKRHLPGTGL